MKKILSVFAVILTCYFATAQNVAIGTTTPDASAALEIKAANKGILIPRTSTASRTAIVTPAKGLLVYDTTTSSFWYHNGSAWINLSVAANGSSWNLTGNAGISAATNFIGTTDGQPLVLRVNNKKAGYIDFDAAKANTGLGYQALLANTTGASNTAVGLSALYSNTTAGSNTAIGTQTLFNNGIGANVNADEATRNTAVGYSSMYSNTTGLYNTALGFASLFANTSGYFNTAIGLAALQSNIDGHDNTSTGLGALAANDHGNYNTAMGSRALSANRSGNNNAASGYAALYSNTTGAANTANGSYALYNNTASNSNTAIGNEAMYNNTGGDNTAVGQGAMKANTNGGSNTGVGQAALGLTSTGSANTGNGQHALFSNTSGSYNTALGFFADVASGALSNATAVGANAIVSASNTIQLGDNSVTSVKTAGNVYIRNGKGIVRSDNATTKVIQTVIVAATGTINSFSVLKFPISIPESVFDPVLYVGNILPGGTGPAGMSMYITSSIPPFSTTTTYSLNVYFIAPTVGQSVDLNFQVKVVIIGNN